MNKKSYIPRTRIISKWYNYSLEERQVPKADISLTDGPSSRYTADVQDIFQQECFQAK